ncbi:MAG TPA: peptidyl-prolyl cis-trans isomerase [Gammaproteobacteria bacterium]
MASNKFVSRMLGAAVLLSALPLSAAELDPAQPIASAGTETITTGAFVQQVQVGMRQRFYHGKIPEGELEKFGNEVLQQMIDRSLLLQEAKRRKLQPDTQAIEAEIAGYDKQYASSERWQKERTQRLPLLRANLEQQSLLKVLEEQVRKVPAPSEKQVRDYYKQNPDKFTTPEKVRVSLILLKVEPSSPATAWQGAMEEGKGLVEKLRKGDDFAALAKLHSGDASAEKGGDLGYIHMGMLAPEAQQAIDQLKPGEISEPVRLLQGVALLRLDDRTAAKLNPFEQVKERAADLQVRDNGDTAWKKVIEQLRKQTTIIIDQKALKALFTPRETAVTAQGSGVQK